MIEFRNETQGNDLKQASSQITKACNVRKKCCFWLCLFSLVRYPEGNSAHRSGTLWGFESSSFAYCLNSIESIEFFSWVFWSLGKTIHSSHPPHFLSTQAALAGLRLSFNSSAKYWNVYNEAIIWLPSFTENLKKQKNRILYSYLLKHLHCYQSTNSLKFSC